MFVVQFALSAWLSHLTGVSNGYLATQSLSTITLLSSHSHLTLSRVTFVLGGLPVAVHSIFRIRVVGHYVIPLD